MELLLPFLLPFLLHACSLLLFPVAMTAGELACDLQANDFQHLNSTGVHLPLYHPQSPCLPAPLPSDLAFSAIIAHDAARIARLTGTKTRDNNLSGSLAATAPLARDMSSYSYITRLGLGTPATLYSMIIDTGSSFSWLQCSPCQVSCHPQTDPFFDPRKSSTYASLPCSAPECGLLQAATNRPSRCSKSSVCVYDVQYSDAAYSAGFLSKDRVSFGSSSFPGFYFGCGQDQRDFLEQAAGLVGLARSKLSLFSQLAPALGSSFSYCLPTATSTSSSGGYLSIGSSRPGQYSFTPMVSSSHDATLYYVGFTGMSVGGRPLAVPFSAYISLPTIIDSGSVLTYLPPAVYAALSKAVAAAMGGTPRAPAYSSSVDTCFKGQASKLRVPAVNMEFAGGVTLKLPARNVLFDVDGSRTCLAFLAGDTLTIIGSTQQQTFSVVFDVTRSRIGFAPGGCS